MHDDDIFEVGGAAGLGSADILGNDDPGDGPDWGFVSGTSDDGLYNASGQLQAGLQGGLAEAFIADQSSAGGALDDTTFSGGGTSNKNTDAISSADCANRTPPLTGSGCAPWVWDAGNVPAKDDLTNVYAWEKLVDPCVLSGSCTPTPGQSDDHLIVYAGVEREDPSGSSHVDIEFLQDSIALDEAPKCNDPGQDPTPCHFNGLRTEDDVVLSMDFLQGGGIGSVTVRRWDGSDYVLEGTAGGEGCFVSDTICAFNNGDDIDGGPWPNYDNHGKLITELPANAFTEIGVDLTALIDANPCLSTIMGKTRSSASFTSELKDFAGPHTFAVCAPSTALSTTTVPASAKVASGGSVTFTFNEDNDGNEALLNPSVVTNNAGCVPVKTASSDTDGDGVLDTDETWVFTCTMTNITANVTVVAWGNGTGELSGKLVTGNPTCTPSSTTICSAAERDLDGDYGDPSVDEPEEDGAGDDRLHLQGDEHRRRSAGQRLHYRQQWVYDGEPGAPARREQQPRRPQRQRPVGSR